MYYAWICCYVLYVVFQLEGKSAVTGLESIAKQFSGT